MVASGHFQDSIEPPSAFEVVALIVWSRLGIWLPERTAVREYRGMDARAPVTGTEWEFEEALQGAQRSGAPDLLVYRSQKPAPFDTHDPTRLEEQLRQLKALNAFWERHFANQGIFIGAYTSFTTDAEFAAAFENHLRKLIEKRIAALGTARNDNAPRAWAQAPFRGLEAYEFEHAPIFFGQDEALGKAMLQLTGNAAAGSPFLLVLCASGSGKSSLVKAGVVPKLFVPRRIAGTAFLRRVVFRPSDAREGEDLFDALARRLTTQVSDEGLSELIGHGQSTASLAAHLRNATATPAYPIGTALGELTLKARQSGRMLDYESAKLVLVVDQLEELYTGDRIPASERGQFIELLTGLVRSGCVWVVATMRKDFWHRADETPELVHLAEGSGRLELLPPGPAQLSQMIRRPAEAAGVRFEVHGTTNVPLNEVIAEEVAHESGALPLLFYLLDQLYRIDILEAHGNTLTYATYERLGKLEGAIATQAEAVLERCAAQDRLALGSVLFSLVEIGAGEGNVERAVARRVPLSAFSPGSAQRRLVEALLDPGARLLVSDTEKGGSPTVRVAHEALISRWAQAREFVQSNGEALKIRHRIEERYVLWRALNEGGLATRQGRRPRLPSPRDVRHGALASAASTDCSGTSTSPMAGGCSKSIAATPSLTWWLTSSARPRITSGFAPDRFARLPPSRRSWPSSPSLHWAPGGSLPASSMKRSIRRHRRLRPKRGCSPRPPRNASRTRMWRARRASSWRYSPILNSRRVIRLPPSVCFRKFAPPMPSSRCSPAMAVSSGLPWYSPDGTRIITASEDKSARIWEARTGAELAVLSGHGDRVLSAAYSPDGMRIVTASADKTARIWDARTGAQLAVLSGHGDFVESAAYSPDGTRIVTASNDKTARIWDARTGTQLAVLSGHGGIVISGAYSRDGTRIVTASEDKTARIWDARTGAQLAVLSGHDDVLEFAAYSRDGTRIVTASDDKTARVWDARVPVDIAAQILWDAAAQTDPLPDVDRTQLGLPNTKVRTEWALASGCDQAAAAFYDPDRLAPGLAQVTIIADVANPACSPAIAKTGESPRGIYQAGRALLAKSDVKGARQQFERAVSEGYRAARIDLANLLVDASAGMLDPERAVSLYQKAWQDGVPIAVFELGHLYEVGVSGSQGAGQGRLPPDLAKAWGWYQKGADAGEPDALRDSPSATSEMRWRRATRRREMRCCFRLFVSMRPPPGAPTMRIGRTMPGSTGGIGARRSPGCSHARV
jgi:WD40 repeat protein